MTRDYELFLKDEKNLSKMVTDVYNLYKPYITKKAFFYERCSKGQILAEDFMSDVYVKLFEFLGRITKERIKDENKFSFFVWVHFASTRVFDKHMKLLKVESCCLDDEKNENQFCSNYKVSETLCEINKFFEKLSERQRIIVEDKKNGIHEIKTLKKLRISHGTYCSEIIKAKKIFATYI